MAVIVRRRSWGGVLPLGRHTSISGSSLIQCVSVSMAPPHLRGAKRLQSEPVQARTGPSIVGSGECCDLAKDMLREWTRQAAWEPDEVVKVDFTFTLRTDLPPEHIVGHYHPRELRDPLRGFQLHQSPRTCCAHCGISGGIQL